MVPTLTGGCICELACGVLYSSKAVVFSLKTALDMPLLDKVKTEPIFQLCSPYELVSILWWVSWCYLPAFWGTRDTEEQYPMEESLAKSPFCGPCSVLFK